MTHKLCYCCGRNIVCNNKGVYIWFVDLLKHLFQGSYLSVFRKYESFEWSATEKTVLCFPSRIVSHRESRRLYDAVAPFLILCRFFFGQCLHVNCNIDFVYNLHSSHRFDNVFH